MKKKTPAIPSHVVVDTRTGEVIGTVNPPKKRTKFALIILCVCIVSFSLGILAHSVLDKRYEEDRNTAVSSAISSGQGKNTGLIVSEAKGADQDQPPGNVDRESIEERIQKMRES